MGLTIGIHWAATTYGTWLHGDQRGSWKSGKLIEGKPMEHAACQDRMTAEAVFLSRYEREIVAEAMGHVICERSHRVLAATIQPTHVHLVLAPLDENVEKVITRLKRQSAMRVLAKRRLNSHPEVVPRSLWTAKKFVKFIFNRRHLFNTIEYVRKHNRENGLRADPYDWISPLDSDQASC